MIDDSVQDVDHGRFCVVGGKLTDQVHFAFGLAWTWEKNVKGEEEMDICTERSSIIQKATQAT